MLKECLQISHLNFSDRLSTLYIFHFEEYHSRLSFSFYYIHYNPFCILLNTLWQSSQRTVITWCLGNGCILHLCWVFDCNDSHIEWNSHILHPRYIYDSSHVQNALNAKVVLMSVRCMADYFWADDSNLWLPCSVCSPASSRMKRVTVYTLKPCTLLSMVYFSNSHFI